MSNDIFEYDDQTDPLYRRHDGGEDPRKGVLKAADYPDLAQIPCLDDAALLVSLDVYRGAMTQDGQFLFAPDQLLARSAFLRLLRRACGVPARKVLDIPRSAGGITVGEALTLTAQALGGSAPAVDAEPEALLDRKTAVRLLAAALRASDGSGALPYLYFVDAPRTLTELKLPQNLAVAGPDGMLVTLTVDGVFQPLTGGWQYRGDLALSLTERYEVYRYLAMPGGPGMPPQPDAPKAPAWWSYFDEPYRAALYLENGQKVPERSIDAAIRLADGKAVIASSDAPSKLFAANNFNGVIIGGQGGKARLRDLKIRFTGNGMDDFQGMGAGILAVGDDTETVLENLDICNYGTVRSTLVVGGSAKVLVKHSRLAAHEGFFEPGWIGGMGGDKMRQAPNIGGFEGNCRATNLLDTGEENFFDSVITAEKWGVLSTDNNRGCHCNVINSLVAITGGLNEKIDTSSAASARAGLAALPFSEIYGPLQRDMGDHPYASGSHCGGYGTYSIGNTLVRFAGSTVIAADYANTCVNEDASVEYCSSAPENLTGVFGLEELGDYPVQPTVVYADKVGVMFQRGSGRGGVTIREGTVFHCGVHCFSIKSNGSYQIKVDNSKLIAESGTILLMMDDDDKRTPPPDPSLPTPAQYADAKRLREQGLLNLSQAAPGRDVFVTLSNLELNGDCYNVCGYTGAITKKDLEEPQEGPGFGGPFGHMGKPSNDARQLSMVLDNVKCHGAISTGFGIHIDRDTGLALSPVPTDKWYCISVLQAVPAPVYQAGVLVELKNGAVWTVPRACWLTRFTLDNTSLLRGRLFVNGTLTEPLSGVVYEGDIQIQPE